MPEGEQQVTQVSAFPDAGGDAAKGRDFYKSQADPMRAYADRNREPPIGEKPAKDSTTAQPKPKAEPASTSLAEPAEPEKAEAETTPEKKPGDDAKTEADAEPSDKDSEEPAPVALEDLAEAMGVAADKIGDRIIVTVKGEDGKPEKVTLSDLVKGQLREADYRHKTMQHAEKVKSFDAEQGQWRSAQQAKLKELTTIVTAFRGDLMAGLPTPQEVDQLRARVANDMNDYEARDRLTSFYATYNARMGKIQAAERQLDEAWKGQRQKLLDQTNEGRKLLVKDFPELADTLKGQAFAADLISGLKEFGYSEDETRKAFFEKESVYDHREVRVARAALLWLKAQRKSADLKKLTDTLPKLVLKPGAGQPRTNKAVTNLDAIRDRFNRSRSVEDYAALSDAKRAAARK